MLPYLSKRLAVLVPTVLGVATVVFLLTHAMPGDRVRCLDAGCDEFLTKPIDKEKLIQTCRIGADGAMPERLAA